MGKITYDKVGDNYSTKDPIKVLAQKEASKTSRNLIAHGFKEIIETRGESAYVWKQGEIYMASAIEGLGTKNIIADDVRKLTGKTYYDVVAHDTVASIINDLISVGATPLVLHAYWGIENNEWLSDKKRMTDFINGWTNACNLAGVSWGGGETPTLQGVMKKNQVEIGGSAVGIIKKKKRLILGSKLRTGDRIILVKSTGINANGASFIRALAKKLKNGYAAKLPSGRIFGEAIMSKSNIYATLIRELLDKNIDVHYLSNITGHGLRKIMRASVDFEYNIQKLHKRSELFEFIQKEADMNNTEAYGTFNMGQDYAIFVPEKEVLKTLNIIKSNGFSGLDSGYIKKGTKKVIIEPISVVFEGNTLGVR